MTLFFVASHRLSLLATSRSTSGSYGCVEARTPTRTPRGWPAQKRGGNRRRRGRGSAGRLAVPPSTRTLRASARAVHPSVTVITRSYRPGASVKLVTTEASRSKPSDAAPAPVGTRPRKRVRGRRRRSRGDPSSRRRRSRRWRWRRTRRSRPPPPVPPPPPPPRRLLLLGSTAWRSRRRRCRWRWTRSFTSPGTSTSSTTTSKLGCGGVTRDRGEPDGGFRARVGDVEAEPVSPRRPARANVPLVRPAVARRRPRARSRVSTRARSRPRARGPPPPPRAERTVATRSAVRRVGQRPLVQQPVALVERRVPRRRARPPSLLQRVQRPVRRRQRRRRLRRVVVVHDDDGHGDALAAPILLEHRLPGEARVQRSSAFEIVRLVRGVGRGRSRPTRARSLHQTRTSETCAIASF